MRMTAWADWGSRDDLRKPRGCVVRRGWLRDQRARLLPSKSGIIPRSVRFHGLSLVRLARGQLMAGWCVVFHGMRDTHTSRVMLREGVSND